MKEHEILDKSVLDYKDVLELEYVLERLSDTLSRKGTISRWNIYPTSL